MILNGYFVCLCIQTSIFRPIWNNKKLWPQETCVIIVFFDNIAKIICKKHDRRTLSSDSSATGELDSTNWCSQFLVSSFISYTSVSTSSSGLHHSMPSALCHNELDYWYSCTEIHLCADAKNSNGLNANLSEDLIRDAVWYRQTRKIHKLLTYLIIYYLTTNWPHSMIVFFISHNGGFCKKWESCNGGLESSYKNVKFQNYVYV